MAPVTGASVTYEASTVAPLLLTLAILYRALVLTKTSPPEFAEARATRARAARTVASRRPVSPASALKGAWCRRRHRSRVGPTPLETRARPLACNSRRPRLSSRPAPSRTA